VYKVQTRLWRLHNDEKEKSQYQDTIRSEAEEGHGDRPLKVLYDYIVNPATS